MQAQGNGASEVERGSVPEEKAGPQPWGLPAAQESDAAWGAPAHAGVCDEGIVAIQAFYAQAPQSLRAKRLLHLGSRRNTQPSEETAPVE